MNPMSFPPGLIPALVADNLKTEEAYHPLNRADVDAAGLPDLPQADAYLSSRLDRFRAELLVRHS